MVGAVAVSDGADTNLKRQRNLRKLLQQIHKLQERVRLGEALLPEQQEKLDRLDEVEDELDELDEELRKREEVKSSKRRCESVSPTVASTASTVSSLGERNRNSPIRSLRRSSSTLEEDPLGVEDLLPAQSPPAEEKFKWHVDVRPFVSDFSKQYALCLEQIRELSDECFGENAMEKCSKKGGWHLTVVTEDEELLAFITYKMKTECLHIGNIAVPVEQRRKGYGKMVIKWAINYARQQAKQHGIIAVSLSALKESIPFYKSLGFALIPVTGVYDQEGLIPGQEYMEYGIGRKNKKSGGGGRKKK